MFRSTFKVIKKALKIFLYTVIVIIILLLVTVLAIRTETAQTYITQKVAGYFSEEWNTTVTVDRVYIEFFKTGVIEGIYVEDLHNDTLIYAQKAEVELALFSLEQIKGHLLNFDEAKLNNAKFYLKRYNGEKDLNIQFITDYFATTDTTTKANWNITFNTVELGNVYFKYSDQNLKKTEKGIDYNHLDVQLDTLLAEDLKIDGSDIYADLKNVQLKESSQFDLKQLAAELEVTDENIVLDNLILSANNTRIYSDLKMEYNGFGAFSQFVDSVKLKADFDSAFVATEDIAYFAPDLYGINQSLYLHGKLKGKINHLKGKEMVLQYADNTNFQGKFDIEGLPNIDNTFIVLNVENLQTNRADLQKIPLPPFKENKTLELPPQIEKLGTVKFQGNFTGFINDFVADGNFKTALGDLRTDVKIHKDTLRNIYNYSGDLVTTSFQLGSLLDDQQTFGNVGLNVKVDGQGFTPNDVKAKLKGTITHFDFKQYAYKNIQVDADIANKQFNGNVKIDDENVKLDFNGKIDYTTQTPVFNFDATVDTLQLVKLNLIESEKPIGLSLKIQSNITGDNIDEIKGEIIATDIKYTANEQSITLNKLDLIATETQDGKDMLNIESEILSANVVGEFNFSEVANAVQYELSRVFPTFFKEDVQPANETENFTFTVTVYDAERVLQVVNPELKLPGFINVVGNFNSEASTAAVQVNTQEIAYGNRKAVGLVLDVVLENQLLKADLEVDELFFADSVSLKKITALAKAVDDNVQFTLNWEDQIDSTFYKGDINGFAEIYAANKFKLTFDDTYFTIADTVWSVNPENEILFDSTAITFKSFRIQHQDQYIDVAGKISSNPNDQLKIDLNDFDLRNLNVITYALGLELAGTIDGNATMAGVYQNIDLDSKLKLDGLTVNSYKLGSGNIETDWDYSENKIIVKGNLLEENGEGVDFSGTYNPKQEKDNLNLTANMNRFNLGVLQPFLEEYVTDFESQVSGKIKVTGIPKEPLLNGKLTLHKTSLIVNYLNTRYTTEKAVLNVEPDMFFFDNMTITDEQGSKASANGTILHENFKDMNFDISIDANKFKVLNTTEEQNSLFYGTAVVSGGISIGGYAENLILEAIIKTDKGTQFNIPLGGPLEIGDIDYIKFVDADSIFKDRQNDDEYKAKVDGIQLNFDVEMTPDAEMRLIFDESIGDVMTARGSGNLQMEINTLGRFNMYGSYVIDRGEYLLTLQNVINKKFKIENGSSIRWNGDPLQAQLDIDAVYSLRAPLYDIMGGDSTYKQRVPVDVHLLVSEKLEEPNIEFDIELPSSDQTTQSIVRSQIRTQQEMNQQVFTLLLLNRFKAPARGTEQRANVGTTTSTELLSNQLSNWLSQISDDFDIGVNYRAGDEVSNEELEVALSTQILNDRVILEGNFGVEGNRNQAAGNTIVGDFKVEYKITEDGNLRAKVFNETNENVISATNSPYTQGAGFVYTREFDTIGGFFRSIFKKKDKARREEEE